MDVLAVVLLIILVFVILSFRVSVTKHFDRLEREIKRLQDQLSKATVERAKTETPPVTAARPVTPVKEEPAEEDYIENHVKAPEPPVTVPEAAKEPQPAPQQWVQKGPVSIPAKPATPPRPAPAPEPSFFERHPDLEKFIGENLVNKIGIAILVLAIGFFVKYAIDKEWIGPAGRVAIGILAGGILIGLAHRMHKNYKGFSSVLVGGGLAIFYFTITLAYHQFHLFSQSVSFTIMVVITAFAVALSLLYDRQELAIIALVGGFMAPFLVSDGSGNYKALFTYLLILNTGLLIMAYNKAWRLLNLLSFIFTAILVTSWALWPADNRLDTWRNGFLFATAFYLLFFIINIANNIKENKRFIASDFGILLANTALYFGWGLCFINSMQVDKYRGLFTASMGVFNLGASFLLFRRQRVDRNVLYLLTGITLTFISLTAPIQLHGNYITLFWASESALLYWLYRKSKLVIVQASSVIIWFAMLASLFMDWVNIYGNVSLLVPITIIFNKGFITTVYSAVATYLLFVLRRKDTGPEHTLQGVLPRGTLFRVTGIILLFFAGALEINHQFRFYYPGVALNLQYLLLYAFAFMLLFIIIQTKWQPAPSSPALQLWLLSISLVIYLVTIAKTGSLLQHLLDDGQYLAHFASHWIAALLAGILFYCTVGLVRKHLPDPKDQGLVCWLLCTWVVFFVSAEAGVLVSRLYYTDRASWLTIQDIFIKTGLPILWGLCSFAFMWLGMRHKFRPLRIVSLTLFSITLVKLFAYDIRNIPAGGKIAAFFCLGVLLLVVSFMYQRLKRIIIEDEKKAAQ
jgi:uncharacterized membrane protein